MGLTQTPSLTHVANLLTVNEETSVQTSCRVHRVTYAKGAPVSQAVPETMTATARSLVWPANVKMPVPLPVVPPLLSAGWPTIGLSASVLRVCKEIQRQNAAKWNV